jgi:hypothetical protein
MTSYVMNGNDINPKGKETKDTNSNGSKKSDNLDKTEADKQRNQSIKG